MIKNVLIGAVVVLSVVGCSSKTMTSKYSVSEPTDYAMSCDSLLNEIRAIKGKLNNDDNLLETFVPDYLLNKESFSDEDILVLSERKKSLQLIYTLKENKGECRTLTVNDTKEKSKIANTAQEIKNTASEVQEVIK